MTGSESGDYDIVVIGAGTAGCILAARLSEEPGTRVLLVEAGPADASSRVTETTAWPALRMGSRASGSPTRR